MAEDDANLFVDPPASAQTYWLVRNRDNVRIGPHADDDIGMEVGVREHQSIVS